MQDISYSSHIKRMCQIVSSLSDMNTLFYNKISNVEVEIIIHDIPPFILEDNKKDIIGNLTQPIAGNEYIASVTTNSSKISYITAPIQINEKFWGYIVSGPFIFRENVPELNTINEPIKEITNHFIESLPVHDNFKVENIIACIGSLIFSINSMSKKDVDETVFKINTIEKNNDDNFTKLSNMRPNLDEIEYIYQLEDELLLAVQNGNFQKAQENIERQKKNSIDTKRMPNNPLRAFKNMSITLNTLLRKSVEKGGVHPLYIDALSTKYAILIERITSIKNVSGLNSKMIYDYCDLVNKLSVKNRTTFVKKLIEYIRINVDKDLSLEKLCSVVNTSNSNISRRFKKEMGISIVDYINNLRVEEAKQLMQIDTFNITDIALNVGFNDASYFSRIFKSIVGLSPSAYRESIIENI